MKIIIAGGSIGGLAAAIVLLRKEHEVQVLEKSMESMKLRGSGISVQPPLVRVHAAHGIATREELAVPMHSLGYISAGGRVERRVPTDVVATLWGHLYR